MDDYITVRQASEKWQLSMREIQRKCRDGKLPGAVRVGRNWLIPASAQNPNERRRNSVKKAEEKRILKKADRGFVLMGSSYSRPGTARQIVEAFSGQSSELLAQAQFAYYRGDISSVCSLLASAEIEGLFEEQAGLLNLQGVCAMYMADTALWQETRNRLADLSCESEKERDMRDFWLAVYDSAIYDKAAFPLWFRKGRLSVLPPKYAPFARIYYVKYLVVYIYDFLRDSGLKDKNTLQYLIGSLPLICEPLISQSEAEGAILSEIFLRLLCAAAYHSAGNDEDAVFHIDKAIALALPDRLYEPFVESRFFLDMLLDERLKETDETAYKEIKNLSQRLLDGWKVLHDGALDRNYSVQLSAREREAARLAVCGLSNEEIGLKLGLAPGTVKNYIKKALDKTGAKRRLDLSRHI